MIEGIKVGDRVRSIKYPEQTGEVREVKPGFVFVRLGDYPEDDPCWMGIGSDVELVEDRSRAIYERANEHTRHIDAGVKRMTEKKPEPFIAGQRVRLNAAARESEWGKNSPEHLEEFQDSVGVIIGLMQWPNTPEPGPEYKVRWYYSSYCGPTRLQYLYAPEHLSLMTEKEAAPDDIKHTGRFHDWLGRLRQIVEDADDNSIRSKLLDALKEAP